MNLNIFVHEFEYGVGHSKAMIEVLKRIPKGQINSLQVICYSADDPREHFSHLGEKIRIHKVPCSFLKPFLLKSLFFQIYTLLFFSRKKDVINISMGVCSFVGDVINIQFCHFLWAKKYFKATKLPLYKYIYKKILFSYLIFCEDLVYRQKDISFVFLSKFMEEEFDKRYSIPTERKVTTYSSADLTRFAPAQDSRIEILNSLLKDYKELEGLNPNKPVFLFAGAYERKGLPFLLETFPEDQQLIVIGKGEKGSHFPKLSQKNIFTISFTKEIERFYQGCDIFVFPTLFEPFGLVIMEAAMSGMRVLVSKEHVGATEILEDSPAVELIDPIRPKHPWLNHPTILEEKERHQLYEERLPLQNQLSWDRCTQDWLGVLYLLDNKDRTDDSGNHTY